MPAVQFLKFLKVCSSNMGQGELFCHIGDVHCPISFSAEHPMEKKIIVVVMNTLLFFKYPGQGLV